MGFIKGVNEETPESDFGQDVKIDSNALEVELEKQAMLAKKWGDLFTEAKYIADEKDQKLKLIDSDLDIAIRANPEAFLKEGERGIKITESVIKSLIQRNEEHLKAERELIEVKRDKGVLENAVNAIEHRRSALKYLSELWIQGYWSTDMHVPKLGMDNVLVEQDTQLNQSERLIRRRSNDE